MGIYDRDYYRQPNCSSSFGGISLWSMNTKLIAINITVFLVESVLQRSDAADFLSDWGAFTINSAIVHLQIWRFVTFQFLHAGLGHIAGNMIALYFFGPMIESYFGSRRYLIFYLLCGFAGPVMYMLLWASHLLNYTTFVPMVGASAGIFGVLIAAAEVAPDTQVLVYGILPVRLRMLAWVLLAIAAYTVIFQSNLMGSNAGGQAAHLGGAAAGYLLIKNQRVLDKLNFKRRPRMRYRP